MAGIVRRAERPSLNPVSIHFDPADPGAALVQFLTDRHLATLTTLSDDGVLHVVPVGFTYQRSPLHSRSNRQSGAHRVVRRFPR